jgi:hypothetical protein
VLASRGLEANSQFSRQRRFTAKVPSATGRGKTMDHEWLFWDNQDFMKQLGLGN